MATLYGEHHSWLVGWLRRKLSGSDHAADLAQDTFVRVLSAQRPAMLLEPRAYRPSLTRKDALLEVVKESGKQFDPQLVPLIHELS